MLPTLTAFWLVIHTTTIHVVGGHSVEVQSVRAVEHKSQAHCAKAIESLAAREQASFNPNKIVTRICTDQKPQWWVG